MGEEVGTAVPYLGFAPGPPEVVHGLPMSQETAQVGQVRVLRSSSHRLSVHRRSNPISDIQIYCPQKGHKEHFTVKLGIGEGCRRCWWWRVKKEKKHFLSVSAGSLWT